MTWRIEHGTAYLLCFDIPFGPDCLATGCARPAGPFAYAEHYLGITDDLSERPRRHAKGRGAALTGHVAQAGIGWVLTRTWLDADRDLERRLKEDWAKAWCPRCRVEEIMSDRDPVFRKVMERARDDMRAALAAAWADRHRATSERAGAWQWGRDVRAAQQRFRASRSQAGRDWVATHSLRGLRRSVLSCVLDDKPVVTPPAIWRWPVRRAAGTAAAGPRDAGAARPPSA
jgi:predicted GIY-YIG superfamily endonuclease